jgi:ferredoxin
MKVVVDPDMCQGHMRCIQYAPELFEIDDMGHASESADDVPSGREDAVWQAVANCPERAISVIE